MSTVPLTLYLSRAHTALADAAQEFQAGMIVVGTRGLHGLKRLLLGSTAAYLTEHAGCSVLVVRPGESE